MDGTSPRKKTGSWFDVYSAEALEGYRRLKKRVREHPLMTLWFFLMLLAFFSFIVYIYGFILEMSEGSELPLIPETKSLLLVLFFVFLGKSYLNTNTLLRNKKLTHLFSSTLPRNSVMLGFLVYFWLINLGLLALASGLVVLMIQGYGLHVPYNPWLLFKAVVLLVSAANIGFLTSIIINGRRSYFPALIPSLFFIYWLTDITDDGLGLTPAVGMAALIVSLLTALLVSRHFIDTWNRQTHAGGGGVKKSSFFERFVPMSMLPNKSRVVAKKELLINSRTLEDIGGIVTIGAIVFGIVYFGRDFFTLAEETWYAGYLFPLMVGICLFIVAVLDCGMTSLSALGQERKSFWALKSAPVSGKDVMTAKAVSAFRLFPLTVLFIAIPLPIIGKYSLLAVVLSCLGALTMYLAFTGIGLWASSIFPNFDSSSQGNPDMMAAYVYIMMCMFLGAVLVSIPMRIVFEDKVLGLLSAVFAADMAAVILLLGIYGGGRGYERLQVW